MSQQEPEYSLELSKPAFIPVSFNGSTFTADVFEAWRFLSDCENSPSEDAKWKAVAGWIAGKLGIPKEQISESQAREFNDNIRSIGIELEDRLKKKLVDSMSSWLHIIPTSQGDGSTGLTESSKPMLPISQESSLPLITTQE